VYFKIKGEENTESTALTESVVDGYATCKDSRMSVAPCLTISEQRSERRWWLLLLLSVIRVEEQQVCCLLEMSLGIDDRG